MSAGALIPHHDILDAQGTGQCPSGLGQVVRVLTQSSNSQHRLWVSAHRIGNHYYRHECPGKAEAA